MEFGGVCPIVLGVIRGVVFGNWLTPYGVLHVDIMTRLGLLLRCLFSTLPV